MNRLLAATSALLVLAVASQAQAADLSARAYTKAPEYAAQGYNWTGCYVGVEGGGNWGRAESTTVASPVPAEVGLPITNPVQMSGGMVGATIGCNYQIGHFIVGMEGDTSWTNASGSAFDIAPFTPTTVDTFQEHWFSTVRGRVGYAWDRTLLYATGGLALAGTQLNICNNDGICVSDSQTRAGWVIGAGVEYAFAGNWSGKLEYLHADFGGKDYISPLIELGGHTFVTRSIGLTDDQVRIGVNYRFH